MDSRRWQRERGHPQYMIHRLQEVRRAAQTKAGRRQLRLVACGCCRLIWPHLGDRRLTRAVVVAERFADGQATKAELEAARKRVEPLLGEDDDDVSPSPLTAAALVRAAVELSAYSAALMATPYEPPLAGYLGPSHVEAGLICDLIRDIFGNPFRPVAVDPDWRTAAAVALARGMYESRDFAPMPVLADAFQDAGCEDPDILGHCRGPGPHVRGCWVVDLVLNKA